MKRKKQRVAEMHCKMIDCLEHYGYVQDNKGKTSGSRVRFVMDGRADILLHKPHPQKELKEYVIKDLYSILEQEGFWNEYYYRV